MKVLYTLVIVCVLALVGCSKDNPSDPGTNPTTNNSMTASINGAPWYSSAATAIRNSNGLQISGTVDNQSNGYQVTVHVFKSDVGTYDMGSLSNGAITVIRYGDGSLRSEMAMKGTVTITASSAAEVVGTFSCRTERYDIANGEFKVKF